MSLVSLTFPCRTETLVREPACEVVTPEDQIRVGSTAGENRLEIKKTCQFFGQSDVYLVGKIVSGVITPTMHGKLNEQEFRVVELESKFGKRIAKAGMTVGITVCGLPKEAFKAGSVLCLSE